MTKVFESSVISYGSQTTDVATPELIPFESSVISYGSQTIKHLLTLTANV